jgi:putative peptidoglycan lipid II flippase
MVAGLLNQVRGVTWRLIAGSTNRRILQAMIVVAVATALVSLASLGRELIVAATFCTGDALEAFLIAFTLPTYVINVIAGSFASALVPTFILVREREGRDEAQALFSAGTILAVGLLCAAVAILAVFGSFILPHLASGFDPPKLALTRQLFYLLLPTILLNGLVIMWSSVLNAGERFALAAFSPVMVPAASIIALIAGRAWGIYALALGLITGLVLQVCILGWGLTRQGLAPRPSWSGANPAIREVIGQYVPVAAGAAVLSSVVLVDQAVAARLGPGSVATLAYGTKIVLLIISLGAGAIGTAVLPFFSKMVAIADWDEVRRTTRTFTRLTLLATIPLAAVFVLFSEPIVRLFFQRGAFTEGDAQLVARVQSLYALQIPFYLLGILYARLLSSLGANRVLLWSTAISFPVNVILDVVLARFLGVPGIALATTLWLITSCSLLAFMLRRILANASRPSLDGDEPGHFQPENISPDWE